MIELVVFGNELTSVTDSLVASSLTMQYTSAIYIYPKYPKGPVGEYYIGGGQANIS